jgi:para-aminobenzoate synthetase component 1
MDMHRSTIFRLIQWLSDEGPVVWLDCRESSHQHAQYSWIAARPSKIRSGKAEDTAWMDLQEAFRKEPDWWVGYLGYDMKNELEDLHSKNSALVEVPDYWFMVPELLIRLDHQSNKLEVIRGELPDVPDQKEDRAYKATPLVARQSKDHYVQAIRAIQHDIYEGRYYELNYSYPMEGELEGDALTWYDDIQAEGAVPFGAYLSLPEAKVCCFSPERFLKREGPCLFSQPIKGTRGRGETPERDRELRESLTLSQKDRAENLMIVDLVRNDFHRIAKTGTVTVDPLFEIQTFPTVHQMVSTVHARVDPEANPFELIAACFPMGSMTGAPKIEVMRRIEELETYKRGIYSGAIGYLDPDGNFDFNVVIRTAIIQNERMVYPVGGAITSDSDPEQEWEETIIKARALAKR